MVKSIKKLGGYFNLFMCVKNVKKFQILSVKNKKWTFINVQKKVTLFTFF